jgi:predicted enzyme related to lactoylglutathione lyase
MISGLHAIIYSKQVERLRAFFRDVLKFHSVDAGDGWLIFAAPPAELAMHPDESSHHELYLMCDDVEATCDELKQKGVELSVPITDRGWGLVTRLKLPSGDVIGLYQPTHPTAIKLKKKTKSVTTSVAKPNSTAGPKKRTRRRSRERYQSQ